MDKEFNNTFNMKGQNLHIIDEENQQEKLFTNSPFSINYTMSSKNRNIRVIKEIRVNRKDNAKILMPKKEKAEKMDYNPIFNSIKSKNNFI